MTVVYIKAYTDSGSQRAGSIQLEDSKLLTLNYVSGRLCLSITDFAAGQIHNCSLKIRWNFVNRCDLFWKICKKGTRILYPPVYDQA